MPLKFSKLSRINSKFELTWGISPWKKPTQTFWPLPKAFTEVSIDLVYTNEEGCPFKSFKLKQPFERDTWLQRAPCVWSIYWHIFSKIRRKYYEGFWNSNWSTFIEAFPLQQVIKEIWGKSEPAHLLSPKIISFRKRKTK